MNPFICVVYLCLDELKQQWETCVAQERAFMEEKQVKDIQVKLYRKIVLLILHLVMQFCDLLTKLKSFELFISVNHVHFFSQTLRSKWVKEAESTQSTLQKSLSETQDSLTSTQTELANTQASLTQTNKPLTEAQAALSQTQSELWDSKARLEEVQNSSKEQNQKLEEELKQAWTDRDAAARESHSSTFLPDSCSPHSVHNSTNTGNLITVCKYQRFAL